MNLFDTLLANALLLHCVYFLAVAACYPLLEAPENGERFIIQGNGFAKYISFSCNSNYVLKGKTLATCNNGKWSSSTPICTPL